MIRKLIRTAATLSLLGSLFSIAHPFIARWTTGLAGSTMIKHLVGPAAALPPLGGSTRVVRNMVALVQKGGSSSLAGSPIGNSLQQGEAISIPSAISRVFEGLRQWRYKGYYPVRKEI